MKVKTADLTGPALDWAVAKVEGLQGMLVDCGHVFFQRRKANGEDSGWVEFFRPSTDWSQGGPIIDRMFSEGLALQQGSPSAANQRCWAMPERQFRISHGPSPLIAAMRCFVASKLGDEVDIPEELCS